MARKKDPSVIRMQHPQHKDMDGDGIWLAESEAEAVELQAHGYKRLDEGGPQVPASAAAKQAAKGESKSDAPA